LQEDKKTILVILSGAKDLLAREQILRCAQDDRICSLADSL
jgi:hypothetical protein